MVLKFKFNVWYFYFISSAIVTFMAFFLELYGFCVGFFAATICVMVIILDESEINDLKKYKVFHDHIKAHFEKEHPDWKVKCMICYKDIDTIVKEERRQV